MKNRYISTHQRRVANDNKQEMEVVKLIPFGYNLETWWFSGILKIRILRNETVFSVRSLILSTTKYLSIAYLSYKNISQLFRTFSITNIFQYKTIFARRKYHNGFPARGSPATNAARIPMHMDN